MKDTKNNQITEEEFMKDIGHGVEMPKTNIEKTVEKTPKEQLENILGFSLTGNEFTHQNNVRIKMAIDHLLTSQAQMMVDIVEGNRATSSINGCTCTRCKIETGEIGYNKALDDILTSYKESGLIK